MFNEINQIAITITDLCNLECCYCHQGKKKETVVTFPDDKLEALNNFILSLPLGEKLNIQLIGGEATLLPQKITQIVKSIRKVERRRDVRIDFTTTTNASTPDTLLELFHKGILTPFHSAVSWDGIHSISKSRKPRNKNYTDEMFQENVARIIGDELGRHAYVTYAVTEDTVDDMYESLLFILKNGGRNFSYYFIAQYGYNNKDFLDRLEKQLRLINQEFMARYDNPQERFTYHNWNVLYHDTFEAHHRLNVYRSCDKIGNIFGIDMNGDIYPCTVFGDHQSFWLGNIEKGLNKDALEHFIDDFMTPPNCDYKTCGLYNCKECPALCSTVTGNSHDKLGATCAARLLEKKLFLENIDKLEVNDFDRIHFWFVEETAEQELTPGYDVPVSTYEIPQKSIVNKIPTRTCHC